MVTRGVEVEDVAGVVAVAQEDTAAGIGGQGDGDDLLGGGENRLVFYLGELATVDTSGIGLFSRFLTSTKQQC